MWLFRRLKSGGHRSHYEAKRDYESNRTVIQDLKEDDLNDRVYEYGEHTQME
jgi:hypothetical protein